jgi:hypothetical protein
MQNVFFSIYVLYIENCSARNIIPNCHATEVQFLPTNITSKSQSLDQEIIKTFKTLC